MVEPIGSEGKVIMKKLFWLVLFLLIVSLLMNGAALLVLDKLLYYRDYISWIEDKYLNEGVRLTTSRELRAANLDRLGVFLGGDLGRFWFFSTKFPYKIANKSGREEPTAVTYEKFDEDVIQAGADFVLINTGFCDLYSAIHTGKRIEPVIEQNFDFTKKMVSLAQKNNILPILTTLSPVRPRFLLPNLRMWDYSSKNKKAENKAYREYNALLQDYCREKGVALIDFHEALSDEKGELNQQYSITDGEHINYEGYTFLTYFLEEELNRIFNPPDQKEKKNPEGNAEKGG